MKKSLSIAQKIWMSVAIVVAGYFASVGIGFHINENWESRIHNVSENLYIASVQSRSALALFDDQIKTYDAAVTMGNLGNIIESADNQAQEVLTALKNIARLPLMDLERMDELDHLLSELSSFNEEASEIYGKAAKASAFVFEESGDTERGLEEGIFRIGQKTSQLREKLAALSDYFSQKMQGELSDISRETRRFRYLNFMLFFCVVCLTGIAVWIVISRSIIRPLKSVIMTLEDSAGEVVSSSVHETEVSIALAERSFQQAASIEEVSASLEEMSSMTNLNADNAEKTRDIVANALILIEKTDGFMADLMASMTEITSASKVTSSIVKTIDEIAFQTNLLSLNAAVEAARAGEAGAGFAVVASEVRNLALRSAEAARNTSELIEENVKKIEKGEHIAADTIHTFKSVAQGTEEIRELINQVASASDNQAQGIEQVNKAISEMDQVTQKNAGAAEESAAASRQMNTSAGQMKKMVESLTAMVEGGKLRKKVLLLKA